MAVSMLAPPGAPGEKVARRSGHRVAPAVLLTVGACDPVVNIYGSFFPAWIVCLLFGALLTVVARVVLAATGLERHMAPLLLVYPSLTLLFTCLAWILLFRT